MLLNQSNVTFFGQMMFLSTSTGNSYLFLNHIIEGETSLPSPAAAVGVVVQVVVVVVIVVVVIVIRIVVAE